MKKNGEYVGVDEKYIPEEEKYVDNVTNEELKDTINNGFRSVNKYVTDPNNQEKFKSAGTKGLKIAKGIGIGYLIFFGLAFLFIIVVAVMVFTNIARMNDKNNDIHEQAGSFIDKITEQMGGTNK